MYNSVQWRIIARELARTGGVASQAAKNLSRNFSPLIHCGGRGVRRGKNIGNNRKSFRANPFAFLCVLCVEKSGLILPQLLDRALAEALHAVRANNAPVEATSLAELLGLHAKGLQTVLRK
jgi:hypothetical protein